MQEGWHYELESPDGELTYNGVVYNEMKGAFSSPESVLDRYIQSCHVPGHLLWHMSPAAIPEVIREPDLRGLPGLP